MWQLWKTVGKCQSEVCKIFAWTSRACPLHSIDLQYWQAIVLQFGQCIYLFKAWNYYCQSCHMKYICFVLLSTCFVSFCFPLLLFCCVLRCVLGLVSAGRGSWEYLGNYANVSISIKWFWWGTKVDFMLGWLWLGLCGDRRVRSALLPFNWSVE